MLPSNSTSSRCENEAFVRDFLQISTLRCSPLLSSTLFYCALLFSTLLYSTILCSTLISSALRSSPLLSADLLYSPLISSTVLCLVLWCCLAGANWTQWPFELCFVMVMMFHRCQLDTMTFWVMFCDGDNVPQVPTGHNDLSSYVLWWWCESP